MTSKKQPLIGIANSDLFQRGNTVGSLDRGRFPSTRKENDHRDTEDCDGYGAGRTADFKEAAHRRTIAEKRSKKARAGTHVRSSAKTSVRLTDPSSPARTRTRTIVTLARRRVAGS